MRAGRSTFCLAVLALGCASSRPPAARVTAPPPLVPHRLRAPRVRCEAPGRPSLSPGWFITQWPRAPRLVSVEAQADVLFGTTSSAVCASDDGGARWRTLIDDLEYPTITLSTTNALVVRSGVAPDGAPVPGAPLLWWTSLDGGVRWQQRTDAPELPRDARPTSVLGDRRAVLCGGALFATVRRASDTALLQSADGGDTWRRARGIGEVPSDASIRCVSSGVVMVERPDRLPVAMSRDAGATWRAVRPPPVDTGADDRRDGFASRGRGCAPLGARGIFCEIDGQTFLSDDDGRRWRLGHSPVGGRSLLQSGARIVGVGGGVAESEDGGRRWTLVSPAEGAVNLGVRGGIVDDDTYWIAGTALWWTDDGGDRWRATLLPFRLVDVFDRRRLVGFSPSQGGRCAGRVHVSDNGGRTWRLAIPAPVRDARAVGGSVEVVPCVGSRGWVTRDARRWRRGVVLADPLASPYEGQGVFSRERVRVEVAAAGLRAVAPDGSVDVIAERWPSHLTPVAARSTRGVVDAVLFGNGTVLRRSAAER